MQGVGEISEHTEIDLGIVIDRDIDFLLSLSRTTIVSWRMIARDDLHRLLNELVSLIFELLPVAVLARIHTTTEVVVLWRRRGRSRCVKFYFPSSLVWFRLTDHRRQGRHH